MPETRLGWSFFILPSFEVRLTSHLSLFQHYILTWFSFLSERNCINPPLVHCRGKFVFHFVETFTFPKGIPLLENALRNMEKKPWRVVINFYYWIFCDLKLLTWNWYFQTILYGDFSKFTKILSIKVSLQKWSIMIMFGYLCS